MLLLRVRMQLKLLPLVQPTPLQLGRSIERYQAERWVNSRKIVPNWLYGPLFQRVTWPHTSGSSMTNCMSLDTRDKLCIVSGRDNMKNIYLPSRHVNLKSACFSLNLSCTLPPPLSAYCIYFHFLPAHRAWKFDIHMPTSKIYMSLTFWRLSLLALYQQIVTYFLMLKQAPSWCHMRHSWSIYLIVLSG